MESKTEGSSSFTNKGLYFCDSIATRANVARALVHTNPMTGDLKAAIFKYLLPGFTLKSFASPPAMAERVHGIPGPFI